MIRTRNQKKIIDRESCESLISMVGMGKVRIVREHSPEGLVYIAYSTSGAPIGIIGERYKYLFYKVFMEKGSEDGLFEGCSQTTLPP